MSLARRSEKTHLDALGAANRAFMRAYPGERAARQPVHTFYGGAHLFKADTTRASASSRCAASKPTRRIRRRWRAGVGLSATTTLGDGDLAALYDRVRAKLQREPVEDFRIDFEDGFGARPDAEEDAVARIVGARGGDALRERPAAAVHRHSHQVIRRRMEEPRRAHAGASSSTRCWQRPAAACPTTSW